MPNKPRCVLYIAVVLTLLGTLSCGQKGPLKEPQGNVATNPKLTLIAH